ncbi:MAG: arsenate reductase ArsC [Pseudomonadales bacterium]|nr:arsenate reductase ArsC [Pseudomonadales bacterium]
MSIKHILFVCVENSCRSQIAQAFANIHGEGRGENNKVAAHSSGSRPSGVVNPKAIQSMRALNYDLSQHQSKSLEEIPAIEYEYAITMGCGDECPLVNAKHRDDWAITDPKHMNPDEFNQVRDEIEQRVIALLESID